MGDRSSPVLTLRTFVAVLRKPRDEVGQPEPSDAGQISSAQLHALVRASGLADRVARGGHWQEALVLLEAAAQSLPPLDGASPLVPAIAAQSAEARYQHGRDRLAAQALAALAGPLEHPLVGLRSMYRRALVVLALLGTSLLAVASWRIFGERDLTEGATWRASSADLSPVNGTLPKYDVLKTLPGYFVHTAYGANPYVDVDLHAAHAIDRIVVVNRHDCCYERARGLQILVGLDGEHFSTVAERDKESFFRRWEVTLWRTQARYVRFQLAGDKRILHLSDVRVYGR